MSLFSIALFFVSIKLSCKSAQYRSNLNFDFLISDYCNCLSMRLAIMFVGHRVHCSRRSYKIMFSRICYNIVIIIHFLSFQQLNQSGRGVNTVDGNINHAYTPHFTDGDLPPSYTEVITSQSRP